MIYYYTGLPGASKTLNAIKFVCEDSQLKGRPVYYFGIRKCTIDGWIEISKDEVHQWYNLPHGSIIFIDEVQKCFRARKRDQDVPRYIQELEDHRSRGYDFVTTSQFPLQCDTHFRYQVNKHKHLERAFGFRTVRVFEFEKCINNPAEDYHARQNDATKSKLKIDKKYFGKYESAEVHTHNPRVPRKLILVLLGLFLAFLAIYFVPKILFTSQDQKKSTQSAVESAVETATSGLSISQPNTLQDNLLSTTDSYIKALTPVIPDQPNTAPIYLPLHEPVSMPRLNCLYFQDRKPLECRCYTQQATRLNVSQRACVNYVKNGYSFDYTKPDYYQQDQNQRVVEPQAELGGTASARFNVIRSTGQPSYPTTNNSYSGISTF